MKIRQNLALPIFLILLAAMSRIIPHYPNFTAVGAVAIFGGAMLGRWWAFAVPVVALFGSNLILNNLIYRHQFPAMYEGHEGLILFNPASLWVYGAFILIVLLGMKWARNGKIKNVIGTAFGASLAFFLITNFAAWLGSGIFPQTFAGLVLCYEAALPFFWNTLSGNLFFCAVLFGGYALVRQRFPAFVRS